MEEQLKPEEKAVKKRVSKKGAAKKKRVNKKSAAKKDIAPRKSTSRKKTPVDGENIQDIILQPATLAKRDKLINIINNGGDLTTRVIYERIMTGCDFLIEQNDTRNFTTSDGVNISGANIIKVCHAIKQYLSNPLKNLL